jgi:toxin CcdB
MARFDVYQLQPSGTLVLDCQADLLSDLQTRFIIPLLPATNSPKAADRLNPIFDINGNEMVLFPQFAATVNMRELGNSIYSLANADAQIFAAIDMLVSGF